MRGKYRNKSYIKRV